MEKIKKIRPQDMAMEQIQWYIPVSYTHLVS